MDNRTYLIYLAQMNKVMIEVEGMKAENAMRASNDLSPSWGENHFYQKSIEMNDIHDNIIKYT